MYVYIYLNTVHVNHYYEVPFDLALVTLVCQ